MAGSVTAGNLLPAVLSMQQIRKAQLFYVQQYLQSFPHNDDQRFLRNRCGRHSYETYPAGVAKNDDSK